MSETGGQWQLALRMPNHKIFAKVCFPEEMTSPCIVTTLAGVPLSSPYPDLSAAKSACESMEREARQAAMAKPLNVGGARNACLFQIDGMVLLETPAGAWLSFSTEAEARAHLADEEKSEARLAANAMPKHGIDLAVGGTRLNSPKEVEPKDGRRKPPRAP